METLISMVEVQKAVTEAPQHKTPGPDGLPNEIYTEYGEIMLPELLLNEAAEGGELPASMTEATINVIPKEGKDPTQPVSNRPIYLLFMDVKILAKVLAHRLSKIIYTIIHPDQCSLIPGRSTALNIRRF